MKKWKLINAENIKPFECDGGYSSKMLTGDDIANRQVININEGTLKAGCKTAGGAHEDTEIYYIIEGEGDVWLDDDRIPVKPGDIIVIPPQVFHWIDNSNSKKPFKIFTFWPKKEQNEMYFERFEQWGTSMKVFDKNYTEKRLEK